MPSGRRRAEAYCQVCKSRGETSLRRERCYGPNACRYTVITYQGQGGILSHLRLQPGTAAVAKCERRAERQGRKRTTCDLVHRITGRKSAAPPSRV